MGMRGVSESWLTRARRGLLEDPVRTQVVSGRKVGLEVAVWRMLLCGLVMRFRCCCVQYMCTRFG